MRRNFLLQDTQTGVVKSPVYLSQEAANAAIARSTCLHRDRLSGALECRIEVVELKPEFVEGEDEIQWFME